MKKIMDYLQGKKTYIVAILTAIFIILNAFDVVIPEYVYQLLAVAGLSAVRSALKKLENNQ